MDDPKWLKLVVIGLVLAALATGYFLLSGRLTSNQAAKPGSQVSKGVPVASPVASSSPAVLGQNAQGSPVPVSSSVPVSAYSALVNRNGGGVENLPNTGSPVILISALAVSTMLVGWGLRRYPR
ncbi:MAG: hypothetical protein NUV73_02460 [Candidatus Daviesbacteria bacterium]|nr:hypothetical protein [Candidatus Daviesbacteria bacterium]